MEGSQKNCVQIVFDFLKRQGDFLEFLSLKLLPKESDKKFRVYKLRYRDIDREKKSLRIELNLSKQKLSVAEWGEHEFRTVKFSSFSEQSC